jgi:hypothetical protein
MSDTFADAPPVTDQDNGDAWLIAWAITLLLVNGNAARTLTATQRKRARDLLRVRFEDAALRNAQRIMAGQLDIDAWQTTVGGDIADYTRQMAVAGAGTLPTAQVQQVAESEIGRQAPFLAGFAGAIAAGGLSVLRIASRTKYYGKPPWGVYYVAQGSTAGEGIVDRWITRDDNRVCRNCAPMHGRYFLPTEGPWPGWACLGICRCERVQVVDRAIWQRLTGRR